jgi:hypothetical protein
MEKREYDKEKERQTVTFFFIFVARSILSQKAKTSPRIMTHRSMQ